MRPPAHFVDVPEASLDSLAGHEGAQSSSRATPGASWRTLTFVRLTAVVSSLALLQSVVLAQTQQVSEGFESPETIFSYSSTHAIAYDVQNSETAHTGASSLSTYPSTCGASCHDDYRVDLVYTFPQCVTVVDVEFWVREDSTTGRAWGGKVSVGHDDIWDLWWWQAIDNGAPITGAWQRIFIPIADTATTVRIRIMDITSVSRMWLDDVVIRYQVPSPPPVNLVTNGGFSLGEEGFSSDYSYQPGDIWAAGTYDLVPNAQISHPWAVSYGDHTCGDGLMLAANGSITAGSAVWTQTIHVQPDTDYVFSAWVSSWTAASPALLQVTVDSAPVGLVSPAPSVAGTWAQLSAVWNSGARLEAVFSITNANGAAGGNDFALDDISLSPVAPDAGHDGIRWVSTYRGAAGGKVTVRIWGIGLAPDARVLLRRADDATMQAEITYEPGGYLVAAFDFSNATPGKYQLLLINPDGREFTAPESFKVEAEARGELWADIVGRGSIRVGRTSTFLVRYGNSGNVDVRHPYVVVALPLHVRFDIDVPWALPTSSEPSVPPSDADALEAVFLDLPPLTAGASGWVTVEITPDTSGPFTIMARITTDPSPYLESVLSLSELVPLDMPPTGKPVYEQVLRECDVPEEHRYPAGEVLFWRDLPDNHLDLVDGGYRYTYSWHIAKSIGDGRFIDILDDGVKIRCLDDNWLNHQGKFRHFSPPNDSQEHREEVRRLGEALDDLIGEDPNKSQYVTEICESDFEHGVLKTNCLGVFHLLNPEFRAMNPPLFFQDQIYDALDPTNEGWEGFYGWDRSSSPLNKLWGWLKGEDARCRKAFEDAARGVSKVIEAVQAIDPNDKAGPAGFDAGGFIPVGEEMMYVIYFENVGSASAPAQEIVITDQLDITALDASTLELGQIAFGDTVIGIPPRQRTYSTAIDLRPGQNLTLGVRAELDQSSGQLTWTFTSLDPETGDLTEDPLEGFLPPNHTPPEGEGYVMFTIRQKSNLPTGTQIRNKATIVFDVNPPIETREVLSTIDASDPSSAVSSLAETQTSTEVDVTWSGQDGDGGSGVRDYTIYVSTDGGPYEVWLGNTSETSATFTGEPGHSYKFYSRATDNVGHQEAAPVDADAATAVVAQVVAPGPAPEPVLPDDSETTPLPEPAPDQPVRRESSSRAPCGACGAGAAAGMLLCVCVAAFGRFCGRSQRTRRQ